MSHEDAKLIVDAIKGVDFTLSCVFFFWVFRTFIGK